MIRAAILVFETSGDITVQRDLLAASAHDAGWVVVREISAPAGASRLAQRRWVFRELLAEVQMGRLDAVLLGAEEAARAAPGEIGAVAAALRLAGAAAHAVAQDGSSVPLDPGPQMEELLRFASDLQAGARQTARTRASGEARRQRVLQGQWSGGRPPYGFRLVEERRPNTGRLAVHAREAAVVREIFHLYADRGLGSAKVAEELNRRGERMRSGAPWNDSAVRAVLRSPMVAGRPAYGRTRRDPETGSQRKAAESGVTLAHTAVAEWEIVDFDTFRRAQDRLQERRRTTGALAGPRLLLAGAARCGHCGGPLTAGHAMPLRRLKDGTVRRYRYPRYDCRARVGGGVCSGQRGYAARRVEEIVLRAVPRALARAGELRQVVRQRIDEQCWRRSLQQEHAERRAQNAEAALRRLVKDGRKQSLPEAERLRSIAQREAEAEVVAARAERRRVAAAVAAPGRQMALVDAFLSGASDWWGAQVGGTAEGRRVALGQVLGLAVLSRSGLEIHWRIDLARLAGAGDAGTLEWVERLPWPGSRSASAAK